MMPPGEFFDEKDTLASGERAEYHRDRMCAIVHHAYDNAPAVKAKMDGAGVRPEHIRTVEDLEKIPVTKKDNLAQLQKESPFFGGFLAIPSEQLDKIFLSPGPMYVPFKDSPFYRGQAPRGLHYSFIAGHYVDFSLRCLGATVVPTGVGNTELQVEVMHTLQVAGFMGTPSFLMNVIRKAEEMGYDFRRDFSLRAALVGAERYPPELRRVFEEDYGLATGESYGISEFGMPASQCPQNTGLHISPELLVEIVDPSTGKQLGPGEEGEVVVTPFNDIYPLIRYATGDLSVYTDEPCACGRTTPRLTGILGRVGDAVKVRAVFVHPSQLEGILSRFPEVACFQARVGRDKERDVLTFVLETTQGADREKLSQSLRDTIKGVCSVAVDRVEFADPGTIPEDRKTLVDERPWD
jgi:phenylacetate-CoA ligase